VFHFFLFLEERENAAVAYVRGEENLNNWRPRSSSLIEEHFKNQSKLLYIQEVGSARTVNTSRTLAYLPLNIRILYIK
jgi:hypothetical protein